jgi:hypothetical protein
LELYSTPAQSANSEAQKKKKKKKKLLKELQAEPTILLTSFSKHHFPLVSSSLKIGNKQEV